MAIGMAASLTAPTARRNNFISDNQAESKNIGDEDALKTKLKQGVPNPGGRADGTANSAAPAHPPPYALAE